MRIALLSLAALAGLAAAPGARAHAEPIGGFVEAEPLPLFNAGFLLRGGVRSGRWSAGLELFRQELAASGEPLFIDNEADASIDATLVLGGDVLVRYHPWRGAFAGVSLGGERWRIAATDGGDSADDDLAFVAPRIGWSQRVVAGLQVQAELVLVVPLFTDGDLGVTATPVSLKPVFVYPAIALGWWF